MLLIICVWKYGKAGSQAAFELAVWMTVTLNFRSSCLCLPNAGCLRVLLLLKRHQTNITYGKHNWSWLTFRDLVHYYHVGKHGSIQVDMLEKELRVLYLDLKATGNSVSY